MSLSNNSFTLNSVHPIAQGSNLPKIGTLIPNRIFVGGIGSSTTEEELRNYFSAFGAIRDVKVIYDKSGLSKGSYGFVTFEDQRTAESIIKNEAESLMFKDRKLNIGYAIRKQHVFQKHELGSTLVVAHNACSLSNGLSLVQFCPHDHPVIAMHNQSAFCYPNAVMIPVNTPNNQTSTSISTPDNQRSFLNQHIGGSLITPMPAHYNNVLLHHNLPLVTNSLKVEHTLKNRESIALNEMPRTTTVLLTQNNCPNLRTSQPSLYCAAPCQSNHRHRLNGNAQIPCATINQQSTISGSPNSFVQSPILSPRGVSYTTEQNLTPNGNSTMNTHLVYPSDSPQSIFCGSDLPSVLDVCGCRSGHFVSTGDENNEKVLPYESPVAVPPNSGQFGTQCPCHIQWCPLSHSHAQVMQRGNPQHTQSNLIQRILQSYSSENKPMASYGNRSVVKSASGNERMDNADKSQSQTETERINEAESLLREDRTARMNTGNSSSGTAFYHFPNPPYTCISRGGGNEVSRGIEDQLKQLNQAGKNAVSSNFMGHSETSYNKIAELGQPSNFWLENSANANFLSASRFHDVESFRTSASYEPSGGAESKDAAPILTHGSTTFACGDISKHRSEQS